MSVGQGKKPEYDIAGFTIDRLISEHEHTAILRAYSKSHGSWVAIKLARTATGASQLKHEYGVYLKLQNEKDKTAMPRMGIARCFSFKTDSDNYPYLVLEFLQSNLTQSLIKAHHAFTPHTTLLHAKQIFSALSLLHEKGFVHGDLHPSNIMFNQNGELKLIDFGAATELSKEQFTQAEKHRFGTQIYSAPEVRQALLTLSPAADVYSFAAVFCALYTRELSVSSEQDWLAIIEREHAAELANIIKPAFSSKPQQRPSLTNFYQSIYDYLSTTASHQDEHKDPFQTQAFTQPTRLHKHIETLKSSIITTLKHQGYVSDEDARLLRLQYQSVVQFEPPSDLIENLIADAKAFLSDVPEHAKFFAWTAKMREYMNRFGRVISSQQKDKLLQQGLRDQAGAEGHLSLWLASHFDTEAARSYRKLRYSLAFIFCAAVFVVAIDTHLLGIDEDEPNKLDEKQQNSVVKALSWSESDAAEKVSDTQYNQNELPIKADISDKLSGKSPSSEHANELIYDLLDNKTAEKIQVTFVRIKIPKPIESGKDENVLALQDFYVMSEEVSQELWTACVNAGKCRSVKFNSTSEKRKLLLNASHPVVNVSWYDITEDFIPFINQSLGANFALPSMSQWLAYGFLENGELNTSRYQHCINCKHPGSVEYNATSMPVVSLQTTKQGMYHVYGNAQEWLQDCWQDVKLSKQRCDQAPAVGGSWLDKQNTLTNRPIKRLLKTARSITTGFRLVKRDSTLPISAPQE